MKEHVDHILIGSAFMAALASYVVLTIVEHTAEPRLLDVVIALAGIIGGFAARSAKA